MKPRRKLRVDREVVDLLRDQPELLALADAVAATGSSKAHARDTPRWRRWLRPLALKGRSARNS